MFRRRIKLYVQLLNINNRSVFFVMLLLSRDQPEIVIMISGYTPCTVKLTGIFFVKTTQKDGYEIQNTIHSASHGAFYGVHGRNVE